MNNIENMIKDNAQKYYDNGNQNLTDEEFDALVENIKQNNPDSPVISTGWGSSIVRNDKVKHVYGHVGSLKKIYNWSDVKKNFSDDEIKEIDVSAKLDGISCVIYIKDGRIYSALTRGDGYFGIDITNKIHYILGNSFIKDTDFTGAVRGELMMSKFAFNCYCKNNGINIDKANQRNITAGIINRIFENTEDYKVLNYINFYAYSIIGNEILKIYNTEVFYNYISDVKYWLIDNFKFVAPRVLLSLNSNSFDVELKVIKEEWEKELHIDGVVLSYDKMTIVNSEVIQKAFAYKFSDLSIATEVIGIEWTMSKNGAYIPVVLIEPITLDGTIVKRVTGFNAKYIKDNNIKKGTIVSVCKKNQIIPQIVNVIKI